MGDTPVGGWHPGPAWLFCPATRSDRYAKALAQADVVISDLEDAVAPQDKEAGREALRELAAQGVLDRSRTVVRINAAGTSHHRLDLALTHELDVPRVMLPKAERVRQVAEIPHEVVALLETPRGIQKAGRLSRADNVVGVMWGADDLVAGLNGTSSRTGDGIYRDVARYARSRMLLAAKSSGRLALDAVFMDISDLDGLAAECEDAVASGFDAKVAIHPTQLSVIRTAYTPTEAQASWARRLLAHVGADRGVTTFEGRMVDGPIYQQAERVVRLLESTTGAP